MKIFKSLTGRKTYLVFPSTTKLEEAREKAKRYFRCSLAHLKQEIGYVYRGQLYLQDPERKGVRLVMVLHYMRM